MKKVGFKGVWAPLPRKGWGPFRWPKLDRSGADLGNLGNLQDPGRGAGIPGTGRIWRESAPVLQTENLGSGRVRSQNPGWGRIWEKWVAGAGSGPGGAAGPRGACGAPPRARECAHLAEREKTAPAVPVGLRGARIRGAESALFFRKPRPARKNADNSNISLHYDQKRF